MREPSDSFLNEIASSDDERVANSGNSSPKSEVVTDQTSAILSKELTEEDEWSDPLPIPFQWNRNSAYSSLHNSPVPPSHLLNRKEKPSPPEGESPPTCSTIPEIEQISINDDEDSQESLDSHESPNSNGSSPRISPPAQNSPESPVAPLEDELPSQTSSPRPRSARVSFIPSTPTAGDPSLAQRAVRGQMAQMGLARSRTQHGEQTPTKRVTLPRALLRVDSNSSPGRNREELFEAQWVDVKTDQRVSQFYPSESTPLQIKESLLKNIIEQGFDSGLTIDNSSFKIVGISHYISNESLPLRRNPFIQVCKKAFVKPSLELVPSPSDYNQEDEENMKRALKNEWNLLQEITSLVGDSLITILESEEPSVVSFRGSFARLRLQENISWEEKRKSMGNSSDMHTLVFMNTEPLPKVIPDKFTITCWLPGEEGMVKKLNCSPNQSVGSLRQSIFRKFAMSNKTATEQKSARDYLIKVRGFVEYLIGDENQLIDFDYIRKCLNKQSSVKLSFVPISSVDLKIPEHEDSIFDQILAENYRREAKTDAAWPRSTAEIGSTFRIKVIGVDTLSLAQYEEVKETSQLCVMVELYHGDELIAEPMFTNLLSLTSSARWNLNLSSSIRICDLPRATRISFTLFATNEIIPATFQFTSKDVPLGWINCTLFDHKGYLRMGTQTFRLWPDERANPIATCVENLASKSAASLHIEFETHPQPVRYPETLPQKLRAYPLNPAVPLETRRILEEIIHRDPLCDLTQDEKSLVWLHREYLSSNSAALTKFLQSVAWNNHQQVHEAYKMLARWTTLEPVQALGILDAKFADPVVRSYAVKCLEKFSDGECSSYLLQLTQVLKYEPYHNSALAEFLLHRALQNRNRIGFDFFWYLKTEMHVPELAERFGLLLESYLKGCGKQHRQELMKQNFVLNSLLNAAEAIKVVPFSSRQEVLLNELSRIQFPPHFLLPIDSRIQVKRLKLSKCKFMDSKKLPLWLVFENAEEGVDDAYVIFKAGDDLRQDVLTLQMLRLMDNLWKEEGLDLRLLPYKCISTGNGVGMLEVVLNADTTANINKWAGGAMAVLKSDVLVRWLQKHNPSEAEWNEAVERFVLSCSGYCVATYVLGIGDRHNDNIMMTKNGNLFHIDFGHFLGNYKKKYGFKRERAPFIFTPQFAAIMGGKETHHFHSFVKTCGIAYNILRKHANLFINLFEMMLSTGIPELRSRDDIFYLRDAFSMDLSDDDAAKEFERNIYVALATKTVLFNDMVHVLVHNK